MKKWFFGGVALVILAVLVFVYANKKDEPMVEPVLNTNGSIVSSTSPQAGSSSFDFEKIHVETKDWQTYSQDDFSFKYPSDRNVSEIHNPNAPEYKDILVIHPENGKPSGLEFALGPSVLCCVEPHNLVRIRNGDMNSANRTLRKLEVNGSQVWTLGMFGENGFSDVEIFVFAGDGRVISLSHFLPDTSTPEDSVKIMVGVVKTLQIKK